MLSLALSLALAQTAGAPDLTPKEAPPDFVPGKVEPAPASVQTGDDARVKRFLGALTGGVVGFGAAMAIMPLGDAQCFGRGCFNAIHGAAATFAPLLALGGAWLGYELLGGDGGLLVPSFALLPGAVVTLGLIGIGAGNGATTTLQFIPYLAASVAVLVGLSAFLLDWRQAQLEALGPLRRAGRATPARVAGEVLVSGVVAVAGAVLTVFIGTLCRSTECAVATAGLGVGVAAATASAAWGVHSALDGRGNAGAAFAGMGVATLTALAVVPLAASVTSIRFGSTPLINSEPLIIMTTALLAGVLFAPTLFLEYSHTVAVGEHDDVKWTFGASPTPGGGMVAATARF